MASNLEPGALAMRGILAAAVLGTMAAACSAEEDADRFREPIPTPGEVGAAVSGDRYYRIARDVTGDVDHGSAVLLGAVRTLVAGDPARVDPKRAVWGPSEIGSSVYRVIVTESADAEYDYVLEGRPASGGELVVLLRGHGYGAEHPEHKKGFVEWNNDNWRKLEPGARDFGKTKITFDLAQTPALARVELLGDYRPISASETPSVLFAIGSSAPASPTK